MEDELLNQQAVNEILLEAKRGKERAKEMGTFGWLKPKVPSTNKRFLHRTLLSTLTDLKKTSKKSKDTTKSCESKNVVQSRSSKTVQYQETAIINDKTDKETDSLFSNLTEKEETDVKKRKIDNHNLERSMTHTHNSLKRSKHTEIRKPSKYPLPKKPSDNSSKSSNIIRKTSTKTKSATESHS